MRHAKASIPRSPVANGVSTSGRPHLVASTFDGAQTLDQKIASVRSLLERDPQLTMTFESAAFVAAVGTLSASELLTLVEGAGQAGGSLANINIYRAWLAWAQSPDRGAGHLAAIWFNLGVEYGLRGRDADKIVCFQTAIAIKPDFYPAAVNLGLAYEAADQPDVSLSIWRQALQTDDARIILLNNLGRVLETQKRFKDAKREYITSLLTKPDQPSVLHHLVGLRAQTCDWPTYSTGLPGVTRAALVAATRALTLLAMSDDIEQQSSANATWIDEKMPPVPVPLSGKRRNRGGKIRIGYLSSDFCRHPISYLVAELIETHDRSRFEVFGYCSTKEDHSEVRRRVLQAFDSHYLIRSMSDAEVATLIRSHEIDVLIDLNGLTLGTRLQVLRSRPAPIQMTYLGYNGPIPLPELDFIIADRYVIPVEVADRYHPVPLYMPRCFQVNDRQLEIQPASIRADAGLPDDKFVFCCFSNTYKITEDIFAAWMTILSRTQDTVLWLYVDNPEAKENLRAVALSRGIAEERLIFASRVVPELYRGRLALADLFLDTFPYNAGTTASDALRVGLPILTISGESFISRMAGALMNAMGLKDGIVSGIDDYIAFAVAMAERPAAYRKLRSSVSPKLWDRTLGDTAGFCRDLELRLETLVEALDKEDSVEKSMSYTLS